MPRPWVLKKVRKVALSPLLLDTRLDGSFGKDSALVEPSKNVDEASLTGLWVLFAWPLALGPWLYALRSVTTLRSTLYALYVAWSWSWSLLGSTSDTAGLV